MKYKIPVSWTAVAIVEVDATSLEEAIEKAQDAPLPKESEYLDGSFEVDHATLEYYQENGIDFD
jgi:hypothetical protein